MISQYHIILHIFAVLSISFSYLFLESPDLASRYVKIVPISRVEVYLISLLIWAEYNIINSLFVNLIVGDLSPFSAELNSSLRRAFR